MERVAQKLRRLFDHAEHPVLDVFDDLLRVLQLQRDVVDEFLHPLKQPHADQRDDRERDEEQQKHTDHRRRPVLQKRLADKEVLRPLEHGGDQKREQKRETDAQRIADDQKADRDQHHEIDHVDDQRAPFFNFLHNDTPSSCHIILIIHATGNENQWISQISEI